MARNKTKIIDIDRSLYDQFNAQPAAYQVERGLTRDIVAEISEGKGEPGWMRELRFRALDTYHKLALPSWGPSLHELNMDQVVTYVRPNTPMTDDWSKVSLEIKGTFEALGIPKAERESLAGVGAQYDSEVVYHSIQKELLDQGVVYTDMDTALREHEDMVKDHFMKLLRAAEHKFLALHGAVWSGGSFVYVPPGKQVEMPLQSYFRVNAPGNRIGEIGRAHV